MTIMISIIVFKRCSDKPSHVLGLLPLLLFLYHSLQRAESLLLLQLHMQLGELL